MEDRTKRILQISAFILVIVAIGFAIWWVFFRGFITPPALPARPPIPPTTGGLPSAPAARRFPVAPPSAKPSGAPLPAAIGGLGQTTALGNVPVLSISLASDGSTIQYYNRIDGKFYRIRSDGTVEQLSDKVFFNVSNVTWAPDRNQSILEYPDGSNILYNFATHTQATLPRHWQQFSFSPQSDKVAFLAVGDDQDSRWLAIARPDGSESKPIEALGDNASKVQIAWSPNDQVIAFSKTGSPQGFGEQEILLVGKQGENFRSLVVNGVGFQGGWSPDGSRIAYSVSSADSDWKPQMWIAGGTPDRIGTNKMSLNVNTWANKCAFGGDTAMYCAVPDELPRGAGLYPSVVGNTPDRIWRVDLSTGIRDLVATPSENHTINSIVVSQNGRTLYFTDQISGQLYKINLK